MNRYDTPERMTWVAVALVIAGFIYFGVTDNPKRCADRAIVTNILALEYRHGLIELDDGRQIRAYQARLKQGDSYCVKWTRE